MDINDSDKQHEEKVSSLYALLRFRVEGNLRYLSHAETMRVFQRACVRAGMRMTYSRGFNPHPRMSLVLPRSVGVESDDEMLCLRVEQHSPGFDTKAMQNELPEGIEIVSVNMSPSNAVPEPNSVRYSIKTKKDCSGKSEKELIEGLLAEDKIVVERRIGKGPNTRPVDVRPFLESISAQPAGFVIDCKISHEGTIRVDEILGLLKLEVKDLKEPVRRLSVQY